MRRANGLNRLDTPARLGSFASAACDRVFGWRRKVATVAAATLVMVMAYGVVFGHNGITVFAHKRKETNALQRQMQDLQTENYQLSERVDHLRSDPAAIEHEAREHLHYLRPGEVIVAKPNKAASKAAVPTE